MPSEKQNYGDLKSLPMDTALLTLISDIDMPVTVFGISSNCHKVQLCINSSTVIHVPYGHLVSLLIS